jgi:hypothetical protein
MIVHLLSAAVGLASAALLAYSLGRTSERRILLSPVVLGTGERRLGDYEDQIRRSRGLRRLHPDPENGARQRRARTLR